MVKALADRLAEAFAEYLHAQARKDWGYEQGDAVERGPARREVPRHPPGLRLSGVPGPQREVQAVRAARRAQAGDRADRARRDDAGRVGVSGLYFSHPQAKYFNVGRIGRDQVEDYARRKGEALEVTERWLAPNLAYEPAEFGVKC